MNVITQGASYSGLTQYLSFAVWLISLRIESQLSSMLQHGSEVHSFLRWIIFHCIYVLHFVYPFTCGWTQDCFYLWSTMNNAATNMDEWITGVPAFVPLGHTPSSGISGSHSSFMFFKETAIQFSTAASSFHISTSKCMRVLISLHLHQCLLLLF